MSDFNFARVWRGLADVVPGREAVVCGSRRLTYETFAERSARLASCLHAAGLRPGHKVAIDLVNTPEYLETFYAALRLGAVPVNVNYRYTADELRYVLQNSDARALVHGPELAGPVHEAVAALRAGDRPVIVLATGAPYEEALAAAEPTGAWQQHEPSGDDLIFLYTGGTTGHPKGVMWRNDDLYVSLWQMARPGTEPPDPLAAARAGKRAGTALPACPLMHGTGLFIALATLAGGGTVVLVDRAHLDPAGIWQTVQDEAVEVLTIVGDAFARPLLAALDAEPGRWDLTSLRAITSSGVTWSPDTKRGLLAHLPRVTLLDSLGASEAMMTRSATRAGSDIAPARFAVNDRLKVFGEGDREVIPGSGEVGLVAVGGRVPIGYYKDEARSATVFRTIGDVRYSIPGDYATVETDGTIRLLGRGSACINTGGEKVYPEEVELLLRSHPGVFDCVVLGIPDERFGERVVAVVAPRPGHDLDESGLEAFCRGRLAGYKRPRAFVLLDDLGRSAAGKADYARLRRLVLDRMA